MIIDVFIITILVIIDQVVKNLTVTHLIANPIVLIEGVFELTHVENYGAAFGQLQNKTVFLITITTVLMIGMLYVLYKMPRTSRYRILRVTTVLIFSGAVGNLIDRIRLGYVIDTFYFSLIDFPVFNVADSYVVVGSFLLVILTLFYYSEDELEFIKFNDILKRGNHDKL